MQWLVRLVTPPGGLVLDPFMGSGSTGLACQAEGFAFIGIEQDPEYVVIARARLHLPAGVIEPTPAAIEEPVLAAVGGLFDDPAASEWG